MIGWLLGFWRSHRPTLPTTAAQEAPARPAANSRFESLVADAEALKKDGDLLGAAARVDDALILIPDSAPAHRLAATIRTALNDDESALDHYTLAMHFAPRDWEAASGRVGVLDRLGDTARAIATVEGFLCENPGHGEALLALARLHYKLGAHDPAVTRLQERLRGEPDDAAALNLLGLILAREFGDLDQGEKLLQRALDLAPGFADATGNLGWVYAEQGRVPEALARFDALLAQHPEDHETRLMRAYACLKSGDFAAGWRDFEARHASPLAVPRKLPFLPCRLGAAFFGRRVFVHAEQGLGDQIMFVSCIGDLTAQGAGCVLECDERLVGLFRRSFPGVTVLGRVPDDIQPPPGAGHIDCQIAMGSLPALFRQCWGDFPEHAGYLRADPARVAYWRARLASMGPGPTVGMSWRGGFRTTRRQLRSIPLDRWGALLAQQGQFISLQYGECASEVEDVERQTGLRVWHWPEVLADYDETAALLSALDLVISVCTAVIHLAGALGKEVWVLTPATPEWRYLSSGDRLPWYPSARLFRQARAESWDAVVQRASAAYALRLARVR